jgi:anti-sigma factor RsiW
MTPDDEAQSVLSAYLDGGCSPEERAGLDAHLATSAAWQRDLAELQEVRDLLRTNAEVEMPPGMLDDIIAAVAAADAPDAADAPVAPVADLETKRRSKGRIAAWVGGMAAAAAIGVAVIVPTQPVVNPPVAAVVRTHAARSSVDGVPTDKLAQSSIRAGFLK